MYSKTSTLSLYTSGDTKESLKISAHSSSSSSGGRERLQRIVFIQLTSVASNTIHKAGPYHRTVPPGICCLITALQREWAIFHRMDYAFYSPHRKPLRKIGTRTIKSSLLVSSPLGKTIKHVLSHPEPFILCQMMMQLWREGRTVLPLLPG